MLDICWILLLCSNMNLTKFGTGECSFANSIWTIYRFWILKTALNMSKLCIQQRMQSCVRLQCARNYQWHISADSPDKWFYMSINSSQQFVLCNANAITIYLIGWLVWTDAHGWGESAARSYRIRQKFLRNDFLPLLLSNFRNYDFTFGIHMWIRLNVAFCSGKTNSPALKWHKSGQTNRTTYCVHIKSGKREVWNFCLGYLFWSLWQWDSCKSFPLSKEMPQKRWNIYTDWFITARVSPRVCR